MQSIEETVVTAMDGSDIRLFPYLPYILQDLWEIGADPEVVVNLIGRHVPNRGGLKALDLGCGKGAVSVRVAQRLGYECYGIDAIPAFIEDARRKAREYGVEHLCTFETGDIREKVKSLSGYDIVILGAIGPVFGDYNTTLTTLSACVKASGLFVVDDGYIEDNSDYRHPMMTTRSRVVEQIDAAGMRLLEEYVTAPGSIRDSDDYIFDKLSRRCRELIRKYPEKERLFQDYIESQESENDILENKAVCSTMVIGCRR